MGLYGAERWILALVRHLDPMTVESIISVIRDAPDLDAPLCSEAKRLGVRTHVVEAHGRVNFRAVTLLRKYIQENRIDILHTHGYKTDLIGLLATAGTGCRLVSTPHGWSMDAGFALRMYEALDRGVFPFFDAVVPLSRALFDELAPLRGIGPKLHLIPNGVDLAEVDEPIEIAAELLEWRAEGAYVVGYIGQLIPRKGLSVLLEAFSRLGVSKKRLAIVGEGEQRGELEHLAQRLGIAQDVRFFGFRQDRLRLLKGFDIFVLPSRLEGIPRCLMEAMAARVAVIASDIPGSTNLVVHGKTGMLFQPDSVGELTGRLAACSSNDARLQHVQNARALVERDYSAGAMAARYTELYRTMVKPA